MLKNILLFLYLFSFSFLIYLPLYKKQLDYDIDDICYYKEKINDNQLEYVKACQKEQYCLKLDKNSIGICHNSSLSSIKTLDEDCTLNDECQNDLICQNKKCTIANSNDIPYSIVDPSNNEKKYFYCTGDNKPFFIEIDNQNNEVYKCLSKDKFGDYCFNPNAPDKKEVFPDYFKVCGEISLDEKTIKIADIGSLDSNINVDDERACKSGFALYFDNEKEFGTGHSKVHNKIYKVCVELNGAEKRGDYCYINYTKDNENEKYNLNKFEKTHFSDDYSKSLKDDCQYLTTKISLFKNYIEKLKNKRDDCINGKKYYNEPFTCGDDELRLLWYEYNHPVQYLLYKNEEDIINYLVKEIYPSYDPNYIPSKTEEGKDSNNSNRSLTIKNMIILIILLLF